MNRNPLVSVIMACYNEENTIKRSIESILNQSFDNFEFIIIDDGSTDNTEHIILDYVGLDNRIRFLKNDGNMNLAYSLNRGIKASNTEYIVRMDADDYSEPLRLEKQWTYMNANPYIDVLGSNAVFYKKRQPVGISNMPLTHKEIIARKYSRTMLIHPSTMLKKSTFEKHGYYDETLSWAEDTDLWLRWSSFVTFGNLKDPLIRYTVKETINTKIFYYNHWVLITNMLRQKEFFKNLHLVLKSVLVHLIKFMK